MALGLEEVVATADHVSAQLSSSRKITVLDSVVAFEAADDLVA